MGAEGLQRQKVEVCDHCHGYLKTSTTFAPIPPEQVVLQDLATVGLDVAAIERGYRPPGPRDPLAGRIVARRSGLRATPVRLSIRTPHNQSSPQPIEEVVMMNLSRTDTAVVFIDPQNESKPSPRGCNLAGEKEDD